MSEEDIKRLYITPAIEAQWDKRRITMETLITDGRVSLCGNLAVCELPNRADYILYINANNPLLFSQDGDCLLLKQPHRSNTTIRQ